jgi:hypothetical protein
VNDGDRSNKMLHFTHTRHTHLGGLSPPPLRAGLATASTGLRPADRNFGPETGDVSTRSPAKMHLSRHTKPLVGSWSNSAKAHTNYQHRCAAASTARPCRCCISRCALPPQDLLQHSVQAQSAAAAAAALAAPTTWRLLHSRPCCFIVSRAITAAAAAAAAPSAAAARPCGGCFTAGPAPSACPVPSCCSSSTAMPHWCPKAGPAL